MMRKFRFLQWFLMAFLVLAIPASSRAQVSVGVGLSVHIGPPALPVYPQPICPGAGYLWTPGYWAYGPAGYYWVPGVWVVAPRPGFLWTPGYWGWGGGVYMWHAGYWGPHVGFYGGINYGFGYGGVGFVGGEWRGGAFFYNTAVMHVNVNVIHNTYINKTVIVNNNNHFAFNGPGGVHAEPTPGEMAAAHEEHIQATSAQMNNEHTASTNRNALASVNHGHPAGAARGFGGANRPNNFNRGDNARPMNRDNAAHNNFNRPNNAGHNNADRPNNASHNNGNHNNGNHNNGGNKNNKPPKNSHPDKENHKPGR
jgi:hypothetical protein